MPQMTYVLSKERHGYVDPAGRKQVRMMPWGFYQNDQYSNAYLCTVGLNPLFGMSQKVGAVKAAIARNSKLWCGWDQVFITFDDRLSFRDANGTEVHRFNYI